MVIDTIRWLLPTLTLFTQIGIALFVIHALFFRKGFLYEAYRENKDKLLWMAFLVALTATLGSLFYSEIVGLAPCKLCWFERIFMYPLTIILGIAAFKKDTTVRKYVLALAIIGALIATFHYGQQISPALAQFSTGCDADGVDCSIRYVQGYDYITIPLMALTAFVAISILVTLAGRQAPQAPQTPKEMNSPEEPKKKTL